MCCSLEKGKTAVKRQIVATVDSYQHRGVLSLKHTNEIFKSPTYLRKEGFGR